MSYLIELTNLKPSKKSRLRLSSLPLASLLMLSTFFYSVGFSSSVQAEVLTIESAINKAGRQRMLSQRILKSYLLIGQKVDVDSAQVQLDKSIALFEEQLDELEDFSTNRAVTKSVERVRSQWVVFRGKVIALPDAKKAAAIIREGDELLASCEKLVKNLERAANSDKGKLINVSGRQRMLSQRIGMLYSAHSWGVDNRELTQALALAVEEYENALTFLQSSTLNNKKISVSLDKVAAKWTFSKSGFTLMDNERYVPFIIQVTTESMLKNMDKITGMYERILTNEVVAKQ